VCGWLGGPQPGELFRHPQVRACSEFFGPGPGLDRAGTAWGHGGFSWQPPIADPFSALLPGRKKPGSFRGYAFGKPKGSAYLWGPRGKGWGSGWGMERTSNPKSPDSIWKASSGLRRVMRTWRTPPAQVGRFLRVRPGGRGTNGPGAAFPPGARCLRSGRPDILLGSDGSPTTPPHHLRSDHHRNGGWGAGMIMARAKGRIPRAWSLIFSHGTPGRFLCKKTLCFSRPRQPSGSRDSRQRGHGMDFARLRIRRCSFSKRLWAPTTVALAAGRARHQTQGLGPQDRGLRQPWGSTLWRWDGSAARGANLSAGPVRTLKTTWRGQGGAPGGEYRWGFGRAKAVSSMGPLGAGENSGCAGFIQGAFPPEIRVFKFFFFYLNFRIF